MNLWIRSQDKEDLVECKNIGLAYLGKYGFVDKIGDIERKNFIYVNLLILLILH